MKRYVTAPTTALALGLFFTTTIPIAVDAIINTAASLVSPTIGNLSFTSAAMGQPDVLTKNQSNAFDMYNKAVNDFESILGQRRAQISSNQPLPNLPGQALYLARINMMSTYKDLTDALPSKIGRPNKFGIPPAHFDAQKESLIDEYRALFDVMEAPPANAQKSGTPFKDVVDLAVAIARAKGVDAANAEAAGRISMGLFFAETNGKQNVGNGRSNTYKGSFQTGPSEDQSGRKKWAAIKPAIAALDPASGGLRDQLPRKPWPRRSTSRTSTAIVAGAILVNAPTLGQWYLLQGPAIAISRTTGINALLVGGLSRRKDQGVEIGVTRIEYPRTR